MDENYGNFQNDDQFHKLKQFREFVWLLSLK